MGNHPFLWGVWEFCGIQWVLIITGWYFSIFSWDNNPNWRSHIFQKGWNMLQPPTRWIHHQSGNHGMFRSTKGDPPCRWRFFTELLDVFGLFLARFFDGVKNTDIVWDSYFIRCVHIAIFILPASLGGFNGDIAIGIGSGIIVNSFNIPTLGKLPITAVSWLCHELQVGQSVFPLWVLSQSKNRWYNAIKYATNKAVLSGPTLIH